MDMMDNSFGVTHIPTNAPVEKITPPFPHRLIPLVDMMDNSFGVTHIPTIR